MFSNAAVLCLSVAAALSGLQITAAQDAASAGGLNQLQMARLPQQVQRAEFPLEGEQSAFKFSFIDDVRCFSPCSTGAQCMPHRTACAADPCAVVEKDAHACMHCPSARHGAEMQCVARLSGLNSNLVRQCAARQSC